MWNPKNESFKNVLAAFGVALAVGFAFQVYSQFNAGLNHAATITKELFPNPNFPLPIASAVFDRLLPLITFLTLMALLAGTLLIYFKPRFARLTMYIACTVLMIVTGVRLVYLSGLYGVMAQSVNELIDKGRSDPSASFGHLVSMRLAELRNQDLLIGFCTILILILFLVGIYLNGKRNTSPG